MPEIENIHSEEVQELMGKIPGWIIRWGLSVVFAIFALIVAGSYFFKYPVIVSAPLMITTYNTPAVLEARMGGRLDNLLVADKDSVRSGQLVAVVHNTADFEDILLLERKLETVWDRKKLKTCRPQDWNLEVLGELQSSFSQLKNSILKYQHFLSQKRLPLQIRNLKTQIVKQKEIAGKQEEQHHLLRESFFLSKKEFKRDSLLFAQRVLTQSEFEHSKQQFLQKLNAQVSFQSSMKSTEANFLRMEENLLSLQLQYEKELKQHQWTIEQQRESLLAAVKEWKHRYLIYSSIDGVISLTNVWSENQRVHSGERVATVVPFNETQIIAKVTIPPASLGKVEIGQRVHIKLSGFPFMEYGMLVGRLDRISLVPEKEGYIGQVRLTDGMNSTYRERLRFIQEMDGTAEIVTKDTRAIERFIQPLRAFFDNGETAN